MGVASAPTIERNDDELRAIRHAPFAVAVLAERRFQIRKWGTSGDRQHTAAEFAAILGEEFGELCEALCDAHFHGKSAEHMDAVRLEAIQVAAVVLRIVQWLEHWRSNDAERKAIHAERDLAYRAAAAIRVRIPDMSESVAMIAAAAALTLVGIDVE